MNKKNNKTDIKLRTILNFLNCLIENPEINLNKMNLRTGLTFNTLKKIKDSLQMSGFLILSNSTMRERKYIITDKGNKFRRYLNSIVKRGDYD